MAQNAPQSCLNPSSVILKIKHNVQVHQDVTGAQLIWDSSGNTKIEVQTTDKRDLSITTKFTVYFNLDVSRKEALT